MKSRRQLIRLWFEFYKLALDDPELVATMVATRDFYAPWGECRGLKFDPWYRDHGYLFGGTKVEEVTKVSNHPNVIHLAVPLNQTVTTSLSEIKALVVARQQERLKSLGIDPDSIKATKATFGTYEFTPGEIRGRTLNEILIMYGLWVERGRPAVNSEFCELIVQTLRSRPRSKWVPHALQRGPEHDRRGKLRYSDDQIRQVRRYLEKGKKICRAVSCGEFPGRSAS